MNAKSALPASEPIPPEAVAEAGVWIVRLHDESRDRALEQGFRQWLDAKPVNARAFEAVTTTWELSENLRRVVPIPQKGSSRSGHEGRARATGFRLLAAAASIVIAALAVVLYLQRGRFVTDVGEQRIVTLEDGTRIYLNTSTAIVQSYDSRARRIYLKRGEAYFDVAKDSARRPFVVQAGPQQVRALGTAFVIRQDARALAVTLVDGKISVSDKSEGTLDSREEHALILSPGQRITFYNRQASALAEAGAGSESTIDTPSLDKVTAWRRGQVVLENTPLVDAIAEMNRYSTTRIRCEGGGKSGKDCPDLAINGLFQAGDSDKFANVLSIAYGLDATRRDDEIVLSGVPRPAPGIQRP